MIRVNEIKTPLEGTYDDVLAGAAKALRISKRKILSLEIVRKSLDSRKKENLFFVHSVDVTVDGDEKEILGFDATLFLCCQGICGDGKGLRHGGV